MAVFKSIMDKTIPFLPLALFALSFLPLSPFHLPPYTGAMRYETTDKIVKAAEGIKKKLF